MRPEPIRVVIIDAEPAFRAGVKAALPADRFRVLDEARSIAQVHRSTLAEADVILVSEEAVSKARSGWAGRASVGIFTRTLTVRGLRSALADGILGYLSREIDPARLPLAASDLAAGMTVVAPHLAAALLAELVRTPGGRQGSLTPRQEQVLRLSEEGLTSKEIARMLDLSPATIRRHVADARAKIQRDAPPSS